MTTSDLSNRSLSCRLVARTEPKRLLLSKLVVGIRYSACLLLSCRCHRNNVRLSSCKATLFWKREVSRNNAPSLKCTLIWCSHKGQVGIFPATYMHGEPELMTEESQAAVEKAARKAARKVCVRLLAWLHSFLLCVWTSVRVSCCALVHKLCSVMGSVILSSHVSVCVLLRMWNFRRRKRPQKLSNRWKWG
jgi:hypothetical protein